MPARSSRRRTSTTSSRTAGEAGMAGHDRYYGYSTAENTDLQYARRMAYRTGEGDISRYPPVDNQPDYEPTLDPHKPGVNQDQLAKDTIERVYKRVMAQKPR